MKRTLIIIGGVAVVLVLIGIWAYVLVTGTTSDTVSFNDFGFGDTTDSDAFVTIADSDQNQTDVTSATQPLRQLTTKPVIGYTEITTPGIISQALFVEAGTGHIFSLDLQLGQEQRISATTIPQASVAAITPNGQNVIMQSGFGNQAEFIIGTISTSSDRLSNVALNEDIVSFSATSDNQFLLAVAVTGGIIVKQYNPQTAITTNLFTIPFREASIAWHHTVAGPHTVYPKANSALEGYVYQYTNGAVTRLNASGFGLSAIGSTAATIYTENEAGVYSSFILTDGQTSTTPVTLIPEKCAFSSVEPNTAFCGAPLQTLPQDMPNSWFSGEVVLEDTLWLVNTQNQSARLLSNPETTTGRQIDVINPTVNQTGVGFYFQNKVDQTLWFYSLTAAAN